MVMATAGISQVHERGKGTDSSNVKGTGAKWHAKDMQAALSTQIVIQAADALGEMHTVGAIQTLTPTESRSLTRISEVGTDGVLEIVPTSAFTIELSVTRLVFDYRRLPAAFGRGFRHIHAQRIPFDIVVIDYNPYVESFNDFSETDDRNLVDSPLTPNPTAKTGKAGQFDVTAKDNTLTATINVSAAHTIKTRYVNCWLASYSYTYDQSNYLITENATIWAETVYDENSPLPLSGKGADLLELFFNQTAESNAMAAAFVGGRTQTA
jgi:hypothetical protein